MQTITSLLEMKADSAAARRQGRRTAWVATMGNLHAGQASLIRAARQAADRVVVSIFVNPLEFGPSENFAAYPRDLDGDLAAAAEAGADTAFVPASADLYPQGHSTVVDEEQRSRRLCGVSRPAHFRGFITNFMKIARLVDADLTFFGQKDLQQAAVVRKVVQELQLELEVEVCPTVRDPDGVAINWRNRLLTPFQRREAQALPQGLARARDLVVAGHRNVDRVITETINALTERRIIRLIYAAAVDRETLEPARQAVEPGRTALCAAIWVDEVRLIDNILL